MLLLTTILICQMKSTAHYRYCVHNYTVVNNNFLSRNHYFFPNLDKPNDIGFVIKYEG